MALSPVTTEENALGEWPHLNQCDIHQVLLHSRKQLGTKAASVVASYFMPGCWRLDHL